MSRLQRGESLLQRVVSIAIRFGLVRRVFAQFGVFEVFVIPFVACLPGFCVALSFLFCFQFPSLVWLVVAYGMCVCVGSVALFQGISPSCG